MNCGGNWSDITGRSCKATGSGIKNCCMFSSEQEKTPRCQSELIVTVDWWKRKLWMHKEYFLMTVVKTSWDTTVSKLWAAFWRETTAMRHDDHLFMCVCIIFWPNVWVYFITKTGVTAKKPNFMQIYYNKKTVSGYNSEIHQWLWNKQWFHCKSKNEAHPPNELQCNV